MLLYATFNSVAILLLPDVAEEASGKARTRTQFFWAPCHCLKFKRACFSSVSNDVQRYPIIKGSYVMKLTFNLIKYCQLPIIQGNGELGYPGDQGAQWEQMSD